MTKQVAAPRRICVVTGTRAEYGLLQPVMALLRDAPDFELQIAATGMHLSPEFGLTYREIEADGFSIDARIEMLLSSDTPTGIAKSIGLGIIGFADALARLRPDVLLVLGDRFEILAAVQAALVARIPVAHISGGDTTEGAFDESIRHSITKMAHLHFVTNQGAARRVRQMGENPAHVWNAGSPGLDAIQNSPLMSREELEHSLDFALRETNFLITFHPATLDAQPATEQFAQLLEALDEFPDAGLLFTKPNADTQGRALISLLDEWTATRPNARAFTSLGQKRYLSAMAHADAIIGNSSSGLLEAPSFRVPTVNIGDRQRGRLQAESVIDCAPQSAEIVEAIRRALNLDCRNVVNPYGDGDAAPRIVEHLRAIPDFDALLKKRFYEATEL